MENKKYINKIPLTIVPLLVIIVLVIMFAIVIPKNGDLISLAGDYALGQATAYALFLCVAIDMGRFLRWIIFSYFNNKK